MLGSVVTGKSLQLAEVTLGKQAEMGLCTNRAAVENQGMQSVQLAVRQRHKASTAKYVKSPLCKPDYCTQGALLLIAATYHAFAAYSSFDLPLAVMREVKRERFDLRTRTWQRSM